MAEQFEQFKRFEYRQNSNLVLQREGPGPNQSEPTGEPESLVGRNVAKMGDKVALAAPKDLKEKINRKRDRQLHENSRRGFGVKKTLLGGAVNVGATVMDASLVEVPTFKPTTQQARAVYEQLLTALQQHLGDQPEEVLTGAADEVLAACKVEGIRDSVRKKNVEEILGILSDESFRDLFQKTKQISYFDGDAAGDPEDGSSGKWDGDIGNQAGVAVVFDEDDENRDSDDGPYDEEPQDELDEEPEDDDGEGKPHWTEEGTSKYLASRMSRQEEEDEERKKDAYRLEVSEIDAHWLQRALNNILHDHAAAVAVEKEVLASLTIPDLQQCENSLVMILKYENFHLSKLLLKNRWRVLYCTRLGQAQTTTEKDAIRAEMAESATGRSVLEELEKVSLRRNKEIDFARNVRREAANLAEREEAAGPDRSHDADQDESAAPFRAGEGKASGVKKPTEFVDIEKLVFADGSHLRANRQVSLPAGSKRVSEKAYDIATVLPYNPPTDKGKMEWTPITELPEWTHPAFKTGKITKLNPIQSAVRDAAFLHGDRNLLICAPTGSGKTNVALLTILNAMSQHRDATSGDIDLKSFKVVYISPMKALVAEQVASLKIRLAPFNMQVRELTGDINLTREQIEETQVIVTTPEKWDIITRKSGERTYTQLVKLVIIDEVHLLHDTRGPVLEAIIARTIRQIETTQENVRLVGLSATLPNYEDVAILMRVPLGGRKKKAEELSDGKLDDGRGLFVFGMHYRPVPLYQTYIGVKDKKAIKRLNAMNEVAYKKVLDAAEAARSSEGAGSSSVLIFVHSRRETYKTAKALKDLALQDDKLSLFLAEGSSALEVLRTEIEHIKTPELKELVRFGFAIHHAGLPRTDRSLVEELFADKHVQVLVSTSTLAWGVNLPARTVIIKGTQVYMPEKGAWCELSPMDVMQMMGRAGRPQYDTSGHGIIITQQSEIPYYLSLNNQQLPIESQMMSQLADILNAEIVLGSVTSRQDAVTWLGYTYLYVRMLRNPRLYGVPEDEIASDKLLEQRRINICHSALLILNRHGLVKYDTRTGAVQVTALGRVASHFYIKHPTVAAFNEHLRPAMADIELLRMFSLAQEFKYIPVREEEKMELQTLMDRVPIPVKGNSDESCSKVNVLLQAYISRMPLEGYAMMSDMVFVQQSAGRIMRAIFEIALRRNWAALANRALKFYKMIDKRMWGSSMTPLRQFKGLSEELLRRLERRDIPWEHYYDLKPAELGELLRLPKMGNHFHRLIHKLPKLDVAAFVQPLSRSCLVVEVTITTDFNWDPQLHGSSEYYWLMIEDCDSENLLHHELFVVKEPKSVDEEIILSCTVPIAEPLPPNYFIRVVSDRWLHAETLLPVSLREIILPEKNPPHTQLLDLQPLPITALRFPEAEAIYSAELAPITTGKKGSKGPTTATFNPIQTQAFSTLYNTNENAIICAPQSSGKTICAELAILRMLRTDTVHRCVFIAPCEGTVKERSKQWHAKFSGSLGLVVSELTGELAADLRLLERSQICIATADVWDLVSRRWKHKKVIRDIRLFIVDELHLLDWEMGPAMEVCVSRMRFISAQLPQPIRMIALAASTANAKDLGEWIGVGSNGMFNFHPNVRAIPLEISLLGFDHHNRGSRLLAMNKPVYQAVSTACAPTSGKRAIIFVADRKQARALALDIILHAEADENLASGGFAAPRMQGKLADAIALLSAKDKALKESLARGVGFIHRGLSESDRDTVVALFEKDVIGLMIVTEALNWSIGVSADLVVIQDTKKWDGHERRWVDYPVADLLQMLARACRPGADSGVSVLLCHSSRKQFYKRFIFDPLPVESQLDSRLPDFFNTEIVMKTIEDKQDAIDWLTWTFFYRRLSKNPNYYSLQGVSHQHLSDKLSELVEETVDTLEQAQCIEVKNGMELQPLNLGIIAAFYCINYSTIELFNRSLTPTTKRKGILEILSAAAEFESVPIRVGEPEILKRLAALLGIKVQDPQKFGEANMKAFVLLYAHFNRTPLSPDLADDQKYIVEHGVRLLHGLVDSISSNSWLQPALTAMELSQMLVQALVPSKSPLMQLPHFTDATVAKAKEMGVEDIFDVIGMEEEDRNKLLDGLTQAQIQDVARACNRFPTVSVSFTISAASGESVTWPADDGEDAEMQDASTKSPSSTKAPTMAVLRCRPGETLTLVVNIEREMTGALGPVHAPYFPKEKEERWWMVTGITGGQEDELKAIKRISLPKAEVSCTLSFDAPNAAGEYKHQLCLMADCVAGADQEFFYLVNVVA